MTAQVLADLLVVGQGDGPSPGLERHQVAHGVVRALGADDLLPAEIAESAVEQRETHLEELGLKVGQMHADRPRGTRTGVAGQGKTPILGILALPGEQESVVGAGYVAEVVLPLADGPHHTTIRPDMGIEFQRGGHPNKGMKHVGIHTGED